MGHQYGFHRLAITGPRRGRQGGILIVVVIALLVISLAATALVRLVAIHHRHSQELEQRQQLHWLAESAVQRASQRLLNSLDYRDEVWQVPQDALVEGEEYVVQISAMSVENQPNRREIQVQVIAVDDAASTVKLHYEQTIELPIQAPPAG